MTPEEEVEALRAAIREAHECIKDLRTEIRQAKKVESELVETVTSAFTNLADAVVKQGLATYQQTIAEAIIDAQRAVYARFDQIADVLLSEDRASRRAGDVSLVEIARQIRLRREEQQR